MLELISALFPNLCIMVTLLFVSTTLLPQDAARLTFGRKVYAAVRRNPDPLPSGSEEAHA